MNSNNLDILNINTSPDSPQLSEDYLGHGFTNSHKEFEAMPIEDQDFLNHQNHIEDNQGDDDEWQS